MISPVLAPSARNTFRADGMRIHYGDDGMYRALRFDADLADAVSLALTLARDLDVDLARDLDCAFGAAFDATFDPLHFVRARSRAP